MNNIDALPAPYDSQSGRELLSAVLVMLIAHRGGTVRHAGNTLPAFEYAMARGCEGAELDVHLSADGTLIVHHDDRLDPATTRTVDGRRLNTDKSYRIANLTLAALRDYEILTPDAVQVADTGHPIPTLDDVISLVQQRSKTFRLVIEIKSPDLLHAGDDDTQPLVDAVLNRITTHGFDDRAILCGFDWRALRYARRCRPDIPLWLTTLPFDWLDPNHSPASDLPCDAGMLERYRAAFAQDAPWFDGFRPANAQEAGAAVHAAGGDLWFGYYTDVTPSAVAHAHRQGVAAGAWSVALGDAGKRADLMKRNLDAVCIDYF